MLGANLATLEAPEFLASLSPEELEAVDEVKSRNRLFFYKPYPWQKNLHDAGDKYLRRLAMAGNRTGKTFCAAAETAYHATGEYPDWWTGWRCEKKNPVIWTGSNTNETSRDIVQAALLGENLDGTGAIPADRIIGTSNRQAGVQGVVDQVRVRNSRGGISTINLKTYDQGWKKWQGKAVDFVWLDEEPDHLKIYTEALTRLTDTKGRMLITFTPLSGETELVLEFTRSDKAFVIYATWDDAPHLDDETKKAIIDSYPAFEIEARSKGIPMLGSGRVFPVREEDIKIDPIELPNHWFYIDGVDFGIDHPAAGARLAIDRDSGCVYVVDGYRQSGETAVYHALKVKEWGDPVAWPHDGMQRGKADGEPLYKLYAKFNPNMLSISARYDNAVGGAQPQEPIIMEMLELMRSGNFKVFSTVPDFFEEFRSYHRDENGKIVAVRDDLLKAVMYALMMRRYARQKRINMRAPVYTRPML